MEKIIYVEIQMAQKLVINEKVVKMRELMKQSLRYFIMNVLITLQNKLRQKEGSSAPVAPPGYTTASITIRLMPTHHRVWARN